MRVLFFFFDCVFGMIDSLSFVSVIFSFRYFFFYFYVDRPCTSLVSKNYLGKRRKDSRLFLYILRFILKISFYFYL